MPANQENVERLDLRFRVESPLVEQRFILPGGWLVWCLLGIGIGIGCWFLGRESLARSLAMRLSNAESAEEAMLALDGLLMLDSNASMEIVSGLEHADARVARTAFRALDAQITHWQSGEDAISIEKMGLLASRLESLPDRTSTGSLLLASSLASRIYAASLERNDPKRATVLAACEAVLRRAGTAGYADRVASDTDASGSASQPVLERVPPGAVPGDDPQTNAAVTYPSLAADDAARIGSPKLPTGSLFRAIKETSASEINLDQAPVSNQTPSEDMRDIPANVRLEVPTSIALNSPALDAQPARDFQIARDVQIARSPATLMHSPLARAAHSIVPQPVLSGIDDLEIEELVRLLASVQPNVVQSAALALRKKGLSDAKLALASELATCSAARRLQMLSQIASDGEMDPTPWLLWMAEDGEPEVRKLSVSLLSSMVNPLVERSLRVLLERERDADVEQTIRQTLLVGPQRLR